MKFLSDEFVILSKDAEVYNFAMPIALYDYNIAKMTHLRSQMSLMETVILKLKKVIRQLTNNWIKLPTYVSLNKVCLASKLVTKGSLNKIYVLGSKKSDKVSIEQIDIDEAVRSIMDINFQQFRFFYDALDCYLSQKTESSLKNIYEKQKIILSSVLQHTNFSGLSVPRYISLDEKEVATVLGE
jgi:hypothetical protein